MPERKQAYEHIGRVLRRFSYWKPGKADKGLARRYLMRTTGLSRAQLARLIPRYLEEGELRDRRGGAAHPFPRKCRRADILLLAETDELHGSLSGPATLAILKRAWEVFGDVRFERLSGLSNGHLYNLRRSKAYVQRMGRRSSTRAAQVAIGERRRPRPDGRAGELRHAVAGLGQHGPGEREALAGRHLPSAASEVRCALPGEVPVPLQPALRPGGAAAAAAGGGGRDAAAPSAGTAPLRLLAPGQQARRGCAPLRVGLRTPAGGGEPGTLPASFRHGPGGRPAAGGPSRQAPGPPAPERAQC